MKTELLGAVLIVVLVGYGLARAGKAIRAQWFIVRLWRWMSGQPWHGKPITDAGWFRRGRRVLVPIGHATRFWHRPRWQRMGIRSGSTLSVVVLVTGLLANTLAAALTAGITLLAGTVWAAVWAYVRVQRRKHRRTWLFPLHLAAHDLVGWPRAKLAASWISAEIARDGSVQKATLALPPGWQADSREEEKLISVASRKLAIESPEPSWRRSGPTPQLILTPSEPPPSWVEYGDLADAVECAHANELVVGLGKKRALVKASLSLDSPHFGVNMGTGGGKSNLVSFWLVQVMTRGAIAMVLDAKAFSHPWLFKDEAGEYDQLPNIAYLYTVAGLHAGLCWLGEELDRRNRVARRAVDAAGRLHGDVGPRLFVVGEELNYAIPQLKAYWAEIRGPDDPKKSPALTALASVGFAGRAVKIHLILVGQMLTAEATGSRDNSVKENVGVWAMARYGTSGWATAVGKNVPMPPAPDHLGRIQLVTAGGVRETQTPKGDLVMYRTMAMAGQVTPCPAGMPGAVGVSDRQRVSAGASDVLVVPETVPVLGLPGSLVTLSEAVDQGIWRGSLAAIRKAAQRPGFPSPKGQRGLAAEYDALALAEYVSERR